jgi:hypothetical protein
MKPKHQIVHVQSQIVKDQYATVVNIETGKTLFCSTIKPDRAHKGARLLTPSGQATSYLATLNKQDES